MNAQIFEITLRDHCADDVRHSSDSQLQAGAVRYFRRNKLRHFFIHLGGIRGFSCHIHGRIVAFYNHIHLIDMNAVFVPAQTDRHIGVDFHDNCIGDLAGRHHVAGTGAEVKIAVPVHRCCLNHQDIQMKSLSIPVIARKLGVFDRGIKTESPGNSLPLNSVHVPAVPGKMFLRMFNLKNSRFMHQNPAMNIHIVKLWHSSCQCGICGNRRIGAPAVIHPVPAFDHRYCLFRRGQFAFIFFCVIHPILRP